MINENRSRAGKDRQHVRIKYSTQTLRGLYTTILYERGILKNDDSI